MLKKPAALFQKIHKLQQNPACPFCSEAQGKLLMSQQPACVADRAEEVQSQHSRTKCAGS